MRKDEIRLVRNIVVLDPFQKLENQESLESSGRKITWYALEERVGEMNFQIVTRDPFLRKDLTKLSETRKEVEDFLSKARKKRQYKKKSLAKIQVIPETLIEEVLENTEIESIEFDKPEIAGPMAIEFLLGGLQEDEVPVQVFKAHRRVGTVRLGWSW